MSLQDNRPTRYRNDTADRIARAKRAGTLAAMSKRRPDYWPRRGTGELTDPFSGGASGGGGSSASWDDGGESPDDLGGVEPPTVPGGGGGPVNRSLAGLSADGRSYTVQTGDTGTGIAQKIVGDGNRWRELLGPNPSKASAQYGIALYTGDVLALPESWWPAAPEPKPDPTPPGPGPSPDPTPPGPYVPPVDPLPPGPGPEPYVLPVTPSNPSGDRALSQAEMDSARTMLAAWAINDGKAIAPALAPGFPSKADTAPGIPWDNRAIGVMAGFRDVWMQKKGLPVATYDGSATAGNFALLSDWFQSTQPVPPGGLAVGPGGEEPKKPAAAASSTGTVVMLAGAAALVGLILFAGK